MNMRMWKLSAQCHKLFNPISPDLVWPSQLLVRREHPFLEGAIHPNRPHKRLNREGTWRWWRPYDLPAFQNPTSNAKLFLSILLKYSFVVFHALLKSFTKMLHMVIIQMCLMYLCSIFILVSIVHVYQMNVEVSHKMNYYNWIVLL